MISLSSVDPIMVQAYKVKVPSKHYAKTETDSLKSQVPERIEHITRKLKRCILIPTLAQVLLLIFLEVSGNEIIAQKECLPNLYPSVENDPTTFKSQ